MRIKVHYDIFVKHKVRFFSNVKPHLMYFRFQMLLSFFNELDVFILQLSLYKLSYPHTSYNLLNSATVTSKESERSCICVLGVSPYNIQLAKLRHCNKQGQWPVMYMYFRSIHLISVNTIFRVDFETVFHFIMCNSKIKCKYL